MDELTVSSKVVRGTPVSLAQQFRAAPAGTLYAYASPPALVLAAIKLVFFYSRLSFGATVLYVVMIPVALVGLFFLADMRKSPPLECDCPACGAHTWFDFFDPKTEPSRARCNKCLAYVTRRAYEISEVPIEMTTDLGFDVHHDQYKGNVSRDDKGRIAFAMPAFCAMCGAEATRSREITIRFADKGINKGLWKQVNYAASGAPGRIGSSSSTPEISGRDFKEMKVPVCADHLKPARFLDPVEVDDWGNLKFASYRFYKAFLIANQIASVEGAGLPTARVA